MSAGSFVIPDKARLNFFNATDLLGANPANFKLALVTSSYTPAQGTDEVWADVSANEISAAGGYSAGGAAMTGVALTQTSGVVKFTSSPVVFTAAGGSIVAWRRAVIYYNGTLNGKVNPLVAHFLGDATPADVSATAAPNTITITMPTAGIVSVS